MNVSLSHLNGIALHVNVKQENSPFSDVKCPMRKAPLRQSHAPAPASGMPIVDLQTTAVLLETNYLDQIDPWSGHQGHHTMPHPSLAICGLVFGA